jgi:hypothetical protein
MPKGRAQGCCRKASLRPPGDVAPLSSLFPPSLPSLHFSVKHQIETRHMVKARFQLGASSRFGAA